MLERFLQKRLSMGGVIALTIIFGLGALAFGNVVRVAATGSKTYGVIGDIALELASIPKNFRDGLSLMLDGEKKALAAGNKRFGDEQGFKFIVPPAADAPHEYLLLSRYDGTIARSTVELVDLHENRIIHRWLPDFAALNARSKLRSNLVNLERDRTPERTRIMHPLLAENGDIIFQDASPLARVGPCGEIRWTIDGLFHHSNEMHSAGGFWVERFLEPQTIENVSALFKEDAIVHVSEDGQILFQKSVPVLLIENDLGRLVYGQDFYSDDPLHMNDVQEALSDSEYWKHGDLFLSLRNISAIVQYRPSENKVIWLKQGPWVNQHDVDIIDDHRIAIFNNNRYNYVHKDDVNGSNSVVIFDFATNTASSPYEAGMKENEIRTISEGRSEIYANGDVFIEESNYGRLLRMRPDGTIVWQFINRSESGGVYRMNWSRPIDPALAEAVAARVSGLKCP